ncbi:MAG: DUF1353 domain-containing protein [Pseudomonadota bacterium]
MAPCFEPYTPEMPNPYPHAYHPAAGQFGDVETPNHLHLLRLRERTTCKGRTFVSAYIVAEPFKATFTLGGEPREILVPKGMVTDLASVPWWGRWFAGRVGPHLEASIVHDYLYVAWIDVDRGNRADDRRFADDLMFAMMMAAGVNRWAALVIWMAIRLVGGWHYSEKGKSEDGSDINYLKEVEAAAEVAA